MTCNRRLALWSGCCRNSVAAVGMWVVPGKAGFLPGETVMFHGRYIVMEVLVCLMLTFGIHAADTNQIALADGTLMAVLSDGPKPGTNSTWRLCVVLPGGNGNRDSAVYAIGFIGPELVRRGWTVVTPVSPDGEPFFGANGRLVPALVDALEKKAGIDGGTALIAGLSNGGIGAIEIASRYPGRFIGAIAIPGLPSNRMSVQGLKGLHVFLRIGAEDELKWGQHYDVAVTELTRAGVKLDARLVPGAHHDVPVDWKELDAWLETIGKR